MTFFRFLVPHVTNTASAQISSAFRTRLQSTTVSTNHGAKNFSIWKSHKSVTVFRGECTLERKERQTALRSECAAGFDSDADCESRSYWLKPFLIWPFGFCFRCLATEDHVGGSDVKPIKMLFTLHFAADSPRTHRNTWHHRPCNHGYTCRRMIPRD